MGKADNENLGIAFALVLGAGAATGLGAAVVFVPALVRLASRKTLASALGLSAGVMTYVSFVEIFAKSHVSFQDAGHDKDKANIFATLCFFAGVILMIALNHAVTSLLGGHRHHHNHDPPAFLGNTANVSSSGASADPQNAPKAASPNSATSPNSAVTCCTDTPGEDLDRIQGMADQIQAYEERENQPWEGRPEDGSNNDMETEQGGAGNTGEEAGLANEAQNTETKKLMRMSLNTALAIGLHNFPEGLATFVAALNDPAVGAVLAIAIAIHNVPEGLCVAMPVYYATGNKLQAFSWALVSGIAEPIAALLGWAVLANSFSDQLYAILFGIVAGMMVIISARELLPTAHRYDPEDSVVTYSFMIGMGIMAVSLVLFLL